MIKNVIKIILPGSLRSALRNLQKLIVYSCRRFIIGIPILLNRPMRIIVGAAMTSQSGWYSTNEQWLDVTKHNDWNKIFRDKKLLTHVVAEHVFEHLTYEECREALRLIRKHMIPGGRIRIAVPDGYHPDPTYLRHVGINGIGADASDHKQLLTMDGLSTLLTESGYTAHPLEGYNKDGVLIQESFNVADGYIYRSRSNLSNMAEKDGWDFTDANTSLIVDGIS